MHIILNGTEHRVDPDASIAELLAKLGMQQRRVAVEVNQEIVPRSEHALRRLHAGDRVELVHALGGG